jgi:hypothetical protein
LLDFVFIDSMIIACIKHSLILLQNANEMTETITRRREKLASFGLRMQPVVVVVGTLSTPSAAYVVADDAVREVVTPMKAVDICFKAFHVFHASYPAETLFWQLLQKHVYNIDTKWDVKSASLNALLSDLRED